jgi:hypothetical protein
MEKIRLNIIGDVGGIITVNGIFCGELSGNIVSLSCRLPCFVVFDPFKQSKAGLEYAATLVKLYRDRGSDAICGNSQNALVTVYPKQNIQLVLKPTIIKTYAPPIVLKEEIYDYNDAPLKITAKSCGGNALECSYKNRTFFHTLPYGISDCLINVKEFYGEPYVFFTATTKSERLYFALIKYGGAARTDENCGADAGADEGGNTAGADEDGNTAGTGGDGAETNTDGDNATDDFSLAFCGEAGNLQCEGDTFTTVNDLSDMARHSLIKRFRIEKNCIKQISGKSGYVYGIPAARERGAGAGKEPRLIPFYFFEAVGAGALKEAASYLSPILSKNISAGGEADFFRAFFGDFINVLPNIYVSEYPDATALIYKTRYGNTARLYKTYIVDGLIENIEECT